MTFSHINTITTTKPQLLFAESTNYPGGKRGKEKTYTSNILVVYTSKYSGRSTMPLYQIYYNSGNHCWGLWKCPYIKNNWECPKWYITFEAALEKANLSYSEDNLEDFEHEIASESHITWWKKLNKSAHPDYQMMTETTYYSANPA